jgi:hypothetical protein
MKTSALCLIVPVLLLGFSMGAAQSRVNALQSIPGLKLMSPVVKSSAVGVSPKWFTGQIAQLKSRFALWGSKPSLQMEAGWKSNSLEPIVDIKSFSLIGAKEITKKTDLNSLAPLKGIGLFSAEKSKP